MNVKKGFKLNYQKCDKCEFKDDKPYLFWGVYFPSAITVFIVAVVAYFKYWN